VSVGFGFSRPDHFVEYAQLFPGPVAFDQDYTSIRFEERVLRQRFHRTRAELLEFVRRAPDEWIFVTFDHDSTASRIRLYMADKVGIDLSLDATAAVSCPAERCRDGLAPSTPASRKSRMRCVATWLFSSWLKRKTQLMRLHN
jgi:hypothetical protein